MKFGLCHVETSAPPRIARGYGQLLLIVIAWLSSYVTVLAQESRQLMGLRGGVDSASSLPISAGQQQAEKSISDVPLPVSNITVPLFSHSGTHHVHVYVGSPPQRQTLIVDTGSKAMAFPCKTCKTCGSCCGSHASPYFDPSLSTTHRVSKCGSCLLDGVAQCSLFGNYCTFSQKYTEGSAWTATEVEDVVWLGSANVVESLETYMNLLAIAYPFGCQTTSKGLFRKQYADGILGVSIHETSLVTALHNQGLIPSDAFSLCITREGGHLSLGGTLTPKDFHLEAMQSTPISRDHGYYSVQVTSVAIGETEILNSEHPKHRHLLQDMNAGKGCILDSGTTDTFLPSSLADVMRAAVREHTNGLVDFTSKSRRKLYTHDEFLRLPVLTLTFANNVSLAIIPDNYMEDVPLDTSTGRAKEWEGHISLTNRIYLEETEGTVLGANALFGHDILFDAENHRIGIARANCHHSAVPTMSTMTA